MRGTNPAFIADRERRLIWPDVGEPDLFLSLGTGQNRINVLQKLSDRPKEQFAATIVPQPGQTVIEARKMSGRWRNKRVDEVLDSEIAWADFRAYAVREKSEAKGRRFIRFNPDLDREPPSSDNKNDMESLQVNVRKRLQQQHRVAALRNVAHRLVASAFYLDLQSKATAERSEQVCMGTIACRFEDGSMEMCALGKILEERRGDEFEPYFLVRPDEQLRDFSFRLVITLDVIRGMTDSAVFGLPSVYIPLRDETKATSINLFLSQHDGLEPDGFPISGFPRVILGEQQVVNPRRPTRGSSEQNLRNPARHLKTTSDGDQISLNGPALPTSRSTNSDDSWHDTQAKVSPFMTKTGAPKMSLADLIAQHHQDTGGSSIRNRTNRFWTYIGNNHMAQHPELYSPEELSKFAASTGSAPAELASPDLEDPAPSYASPTLTNASTSSLAQQDAVHELESRDKITRELREQRAVAQRQQEQWQHRQQTRRPVVSPPPQYPQSPQAPTPITPSIQIQPAIEVQHHQQQIRHRRGPSREAIPSVAETEFEEENDARSTYSGGEVRVAQARPVVQVSRRESTPGHAFGPNGMLCVDSKTLTAPTTLSDP